MHKKSLLRMGV